MPNEFNIVRTPDKTAFNASNCMDSPCALRKMEIMQIIFYYVYERFSYTMGTERDIMEIP